MVGYIKSKHTSLTLFINLFQEFRLRPSHSVGTLVVGGSDGWRQLMAPVGGSGEKTSEFFLVPNELKSPPKQHVFLFVFHIRGVDGSDPNLDKSIF